MIGELYDADNVVVGQAAVFWAALGTPMPDPGNANMDDPFDLSVFFSYTLTVGSGVTGYTLTDSHGNVTSSLVTASTASEIETALNALTPSGTQYVVTGEASPFTIALSEYDTLTASAFTGGTGHLAGGLWTPTGATDQGWQYATNKSTQAIQIEEQSTPVGETITTQGVTLQGSLSEDITRTLALAYNATVTSTAATDDDPGYDEIALTDTILYYAVLLVTTNAEGNPRWIYAPKWSQLAETSTAFRRAADKRMYPVAFQTLCKPGQIVVIEFTEPATG